MRFLLALFLLSATLAHAQEPTTTIKFRFYKQQMRDVTKAGSVYTFRCDGEAMDAEIMESPGASDLGVDEFVITNTEKTFTVTIFKDMTYLAEILTAGNVKQQCLKGDLKTFP